MHGVLSSWPASAWSAISGPFGGTVLVVIVAAGLSLRALDRAQHRWSAWIGAGAVLASALFGLVLGREVSLPGLALAQGEVDHAGQAIGVPPVDSRLSVFLHGEPMRPDQGKSTAVHYTVTVRDDSGDVVSRSGTFEEHWERRRVGRGVRMPAVAANLDARIDLPDSSRRRALTIDFEKLDGQLMQPISVEVAQGPPTVTQVAIVGGVLFLISLMADAVERHKTAFSPAVGFLVTFTVLLLDGVSPSDPIQAVLGPVLLSCVTALPAVWLLRRFTTLTPHPSPGGRPGALTL